MSQHLSSSGNPHPQKAYIGTSFGDVWPTLLRDIYLHGATQFSRGSATRELRNVQVSVSDMLANIHYSDSRDLNYKFAVAEWLWIWFGLNDVATITQYNSNMAKFSDNGFILAGAYGPRLNAQKQYVRDILYADPGSRQAVMTIFSPTPAMSKDIPCTLSLQLLIRDSTVHATVNMRSSDIWLGLPYDFFSFSMFVNSLMTGAFFNDLKLGSLTFNLASSHMYLTDKEKAEKYFDNASFSYFGRSPRFEYAPADVLNLALIDRMDYTNELLPPWRIYNKILVEPRENAIQHLRDAYGTHV